MSASRSGAGAHAGAYTPSALVEQAATSVAGLTVDIQIDENGDYVLFFTQVE